jgi:hypothetical protein
MSGFVLGEDRAKGERPADLGGVAAHVLAVAREHAELVAEVFDQPVEVELTADSGLRLAVFTAEPGTRSAEALELLASWTATPKVGAVGETPPS